MVAARSTRQVVTELIENAEDRILLVTYATYPDPQVFDALRAALKRNVGVDLVREDWWPDQQFADHAGSIAPGIHLWRWPTPRPARLHAKVIVVDEAAALISSANLTGAAMDRNIEAGVHVLGGTLPKNLARHFEHLISTGDLTSG
jgi:phosphatidylserine/phosphatidylglycerophosphate/cardiolipin synthase-like enzyme